MNEEVKILLTNVISRSEVFCVNNRSYNSRINLIVGIDLALKIRAQDFLSDFTKWIEFKIDKKFSIHWSLFILEHLSYDDEIQAIECFERLFLEFLGSCEVE